METKSLKNRLTKIQAANPGFFRTEPNSPREWVGGGNAFLCLCVPTSGWGPWDGMVLLAELGSRTEGGALRAPSRLPL